MWIKGLVKVLNANVIADWLIGSVQSRLSRSRHKPGAQTTKGFAEKYGRRDDIRSGVQKQKEDIKQSRWADPEQVDCRWHETSERSVGERPGKRAGRGPAGRFVPCQSAGRVIHACLFMFTRKKIRRCWISLWLRKIFHTIYVLIKISIEKWTAQKL